MTPTKEEAYKAIPDILYVIDQCIACYIWEKAIKPHINTNADPICIKIIEDATLESTLFFIRKLNEFFGKKKQNSNDDTLRAYHFGEFLENGWFLSLDEYKELHVRVGHISVEEVRHGKKEWPTNYYATKALSKSYSFLKFLYESNEISMETRGKIREKLEQLQTILKED